jgi:hypothetical protein
MDLNLLLHHNLVVFLEMHINKETNLREDWVFKDLIQRELDIQVVVRHCGERS